MENYKIKVNTPEESERAQRAFFALGNVWLIGRKTVCNTCYKYLYANSEGFGIIEYGKTQKEFDTDESKEITLPELEALAQKAQIGEGLNSFETMVNEKTSIQTNIEKARGNSWAFFIFACGFKKMAIFVAFQNRRTVPELGNL